MSRLDITGRRNKMNRNLFFVLLAGGTINNYPKALIKTPNNTPIIQEILSIIKNLNYNEYKINHYSTAILYPPLFEKEFLQFEHFLADQSKKIILIQAGETLQETISNFIDYCKNLHDDFYILFSATDTPLINLESLDDIIKRFSLLDGDLFYPFVSQEVYKVQFGSKLAKKRTFVKLSKDKFCSTGIVIIKKSTLLLHWENIKLILQNRKSPHKIISILKLNPFVIFKILIGKLTVLELEKEINKIFNIKAQGLLTNYANLAFNIDNNQDLEDYSKINKNIKI